MSVCLAAVPKRSLGPHRTGVLRVVNETFLQQGLQNPSIEDVNPTLDMELLQGVRFVPRNKPLQTNKCKRRTYDTAFM